MRAEFLVLVVIAIVCLPFASGENDYAQDGAEFTLQWEVDFGEVYISTQPVSSDRAIFVRTSTSSLSQGVPSVYSLNFAGDENWRVQNFNSTFQDMAPLEFVESGIGDCGTWPDMLLVGWSDGLFQALNANTGAVVWQYQTQINSWGITGQMFIESETVTLPTRLGVDKLCLNGDLEFSHETGLGWRNGVSKSEGFYWIGDEMGNLWSVTNEGVTKHFIAEGKIRHAPISLADDNLLIHLQTSSGSTIYRFDTTSNQSSVVVNSGYGPGMPIIVDDYVITADSQFLHSISCEIQCSVNDVEEFTSNGEISNVFGRIMLPQNTVDGGYGQFEIYDDGELMPLEMATYDDDWYGTAGIESWSSDGIQHMLLANDNANLKMFSTNAVSMPEESQNSDWPTILAILSALIIVSISSIQLLRERFQSAFKFFILFATILLFFTFGDIVEAWSELVNDDAPASNVWDDEWPDEWLGTQIVVFEFKDQTIVTGGLLGNANVLDATMDAANKQGLEMDIIDSSLGKYVVSIDNVAGEGWEYSVNGQPGTVSAEYSGLQSDGIVVWKQL